MRSNFPKISGRSNSVQKYDNCAFSFYFNSLHFIHELNTWRNVTRAFKTIVLCLPVCLSAMYVLHVSACQGYQLDVSTGLIAMPAVSVSMCVSSLPSFELVDCPVCAQPDQLVQLVYDLEHLDSKILTLKLISSLQYILHPDQFQTQSN